MKVKRKRRLLALMLGICLLLSTQIVAFAEDNNTDAEAQAGTTVATEETPEDVPSVAAITGESTVEVGKTITLTGSGNRNHSWTSSDRSVATVSENRGGQTATVTGVSAGTATITHTYGWNNRETYTITVTNPSTGTGGKIEAKVYLRYSNEVPGGINNEGDKSEFGPSGNNTPYTTVTVDLDKVNKRLTAERNSSGYTYYSIDNDSWNGSDNRVDQVKQFWSIIRDAIDAEDRETLDAIFGDDMYIGYVLKKETDDWHIDGILAEEPPVYVVELYNDGIPLFAISQPEGSNEVTGVTYEKFIAQLKSTLSGTGYTYTTKEEDRIVVTYEKGGKSYEATITPYTGDDYTVNYHIYPEGKDGYDFGYRAVTPDTYYLCRLQITTKEIISQDLTITKKVAGSAANTEEHFGFTVTMQNAAGKIYEVTYSGNEDCVETHSESIEFDNKGIANLRLKDGESATIAGLPEGSVSIAEAETATAYEVSYTIGDSKESGRTASVNLSGNDTTVNYTNTLNAVPQTGLDTNNRPYVIGLLAALLTGSVFAVIGRRKRMRHE